ncbi:hypothetical protein FQN57_005384 [Myotisia sp. PD_48]|nr:hypothetical protein FQN57_005384 [Myotisia sp. PD_48]
MFRSQDSGIDAVLRPAPPTTWDQFWESPALFLARKIYNRCASKLNITQIVSATTPNPTRTVTVVCIADTHNTRPRIPHGDILLHAGDLTQGGTQSEIQEAVDWLNAQPHRYKVAIAGNHEERLDSTFAKSFPKPPRIDWGNVIYLENSSTTLLCAGSREFKIYGSPWSPQHGNGAFQHPRSNDVWHGNIPSDVDILLTHTPPRAHLDLGHGCDHLLRELWTMRKKPILHVFGHIHAAYGQETVLFDEFQLAYEDVIGGRAGVAGVLWLVYEYLKTFIFSRRCSAGGATLMANASIVHGQKDELMREPLVIDL